MGVFDSIWIPCKRCGKEMEFQSKAGCCPSLENYTLETAPKHMLADIEGPFECEYCGQKGKIEVEIKVNVLWKDEAPAG